MTAAPVVHLVGAGPGDPMLLTRRAARLLASAHVVVLDRHSLDNIAALAPPGAERVFVGRTDGHPAWDTEAIADLLADRAANGAECAGTRQEHGAPSQPVADVAANGAEYAGTHHRDGTSSQPVADVAANGAESAGTHQRDGTSAQSIDTDRHEAWPTVVRLKSGDPFVCSRGGEEMAALHARGIHVEVTPGVSAATAAPLAAGMPRGRTVTFLAGNDDPVHPATDIAALADPASSLVVLVGRARQGTLANTLVAAGLDPGTPAAVVHGATRPGAQVIHTTLGDLGRHRLPPPATVVIGPAEMPRAHP